MHACRSTLEDPTDFASIANVGVFCLNGAQDAANVIRDQLVKPGFRILCPSQRLFGAPALTLAAIERSQDNAVFKYASGSDMTVACFNFALRDGLETADRLRDSGVHCDVFHVNFVPDMDATLVLESSARTGKLLLLDDSKSVTKFGDVLVTRMAEQGLGVAVRSITRRGIPAEEYGVCEDRFAIDHDAVLSFARTATPLIR